MSSGKLNRLLIGTLAFITTCLAVAGENPFQVSYTCKGPDKFSLSIQYPPTINTKGYLLPPEEHPQLIAKKIETYDALSTDKKYFNAKGKITDDPAEMSSSVTLVAGARGRDVDLGVTTSTYTQERTWNPRAACHERRRNGGPSYVEMYNCDALPVKQARWGTTQSYRIVLNEKAPEFKVKIKSHEFTCSADPQNKIVIDHYRPTVRSGTHIEAMAEGSPANP